VKNYATLFKLVRVVLLVVVVIILSNSKRRNKDTHVSEKVKIKFPWYVIGFAILCILFSIGVIPNWASNASNQISHLLEITALSAIGLNVNIKLIVQQGKSLSFYALCIVGFQVLLAILFIQILY